MNKSDKTKILEAYFDKTINKEEMEFLLQVGTHVPPIEWINPNKKKKLNNDRKRELISKVFGRTFPKIVWIKSKQIN
jgi:hypothetical protein